MTCLHSEPGIHSLERGTGISSLHSEPRIHSLERGAGISGLHSEPGLHSMERDPEISVLYNGPGLHSEQGMPRYQRDPGMEKKGMTFDHDFCYSISFSSSLFLKFG